MERTLNISEPQVLLHFPNDGGGLFHHHRVCLHKIGGGQWVLLTPDLDLEVVDLSTARHRVLARHAPFPGDIIDECYIFDDLSKAELERQRRLAKTMGAILDDSADVNVDRQVWIVADPSSKRFGEQIPDDSVGDVVSLGQFGVVQWDGETDFVREMGADAVAEFKEKRKESLGDARLLGDHRDPQGKRFLGLNDALALMTQDKFDDWAFTGPRSVLEYLQAIRDGPGDLASYHLGWVRSSGVSAASAIAHEHRSLVETLRLAISRDQLDVSNLCSFENICRRLLTLEMAVARNSAAPDFTGLEVISEAPISSQGQAYVSNMATWVTDRLKEKAQIQKQSRLFREEFNRGGRKQGEDEETAGGGKRWKYKKKTKTDGGGGPASTTGA